MRIICMCVNTNKCMYMYMMEDTKLCGYSLVGCFPVFEENVEQTVAAFSL